jgi:L-alanine-DL-glutamate epimerase-like enolase superfamily enzyme
MKITDVTLTLFAWDDIPATSYGAHTGRFSGQTRLGLLALVTDQGITGHAFLGSAFYAADMDGASLIRSLKPLLMGQNPLDRERLGKAMWKRVRTTTVRSIGAVDIALWDIAGQLAGLPVHSLLGSYRDRVPAYISSAVLPTAQAYAEEAQHYQSRNLAAYKIHPPQVWRDDIKVCEAVRQAVGDDYLLMLDAAWSYDYAAALRVGQAIQNLNYYWYEDPLADNDIYNYVELRKKLHIPIMATEYPAGGLDSFTPWIKERATDFLRGDVAVKGGITTLMKAAHLAEAFHLNFELHHGGNSLNNFANLHVIMALQNTEFFEVLLPAESQKYGLVQDIEIDSDGWVRAPTQPGIGAQIDFELIARKKVAVLG